MSLFPGRAGTPPRIPKNLEKGLGTLLTTVLKNYLSLLLTAVMDHRR
jgi:hypothetical protein